MKKQIILPVLTLVTLGVVTLGAFTVSAQTQDGQMPYSNLITKIAQKFNLNETEVKAVFDADRQDRHAKMQKRFSDELSQLVTDGKITEAQKQATLTKMQEIQTKREANRESIKDMTPDARRAAMESERQELESWAKEQGIDLTLIKGFGMHMRGAGHGMGFGMGRGQDQTDLKTDQQ